MARRKLKVALIFGGTSQEREVSLRSGATMAKYLDPKKYNVIKIEIPKQLSRLKPGLADVALLAMHGPGGEDGTLQGMLELYNIPYTCSGVLASSLAMDKARTKHMAAAAGINVADHLLVRKEAFLENPSRIIKQVKHKKIVVKPNRLGSSLGTSIVLGKAAIKDAVFKALKHDREVLIEPYIKGRELTVPVLGNNNPIPLPVIEIVPRVSNFFDYKAKYEVGGSDEIVPALIPNLLTKELQKLAVAVHKLLGCRGVTRSDFIVTEQGEIYFLEINTIPGMTPASLTPKSAVAAGIPYAKLLDKLIALALEK